MSVLVSDYEESQDHGLPAGRAAHGAIPGRYGDAGANLVHAPDLIVGRNCPRWQTALGRLFIST